MLKLQTLTLNALRSFCKKFLPTTLSQSENSLNTIEFLTLQQVLEIHDRAIRISGEVPGIIKPNELASAVHQPQSSFFGVYLYKSIFEMASRYAFHIAENQSFRNANKRTGMISAILFLKLNGYKLYDPKNLFYELMIEIANKTKDAKDVEEFLSGRSYRSLFRKLQLIFS